MRRSIRVAGIGCVTLAAAAVGAPALASDQPAGHGRHGNEVKHVLLISVDGMHQSDLAWYTRTHPSSALASLVRHGTSFANARTPFPSDSFPGLIGQVTGGNPKTTGIWYDVSYNHALLPPGTTNCAAATPGTPVNFDESIDRDLTRLDAGQGLAGLPGSILGMTAVLPARCRAAISCSSRPTSRSTKVRAEARTGPGVTPSARYPPGRPPDVGSFWAVETDWKFSPRIAGTPT